MENRKNEKRKTFSVCVTKIKALMNIFRKNIVARKTSIFSIKLHLNTFFVEKL